MESERPDLKKKKKVTGEEDKNKNRQQKVCKRASRDKER